MVVMKVEAAFFREPLTEHHFKRMEIRYGLDWETH